MRDSTSGLLDQAKALIAAGANPNIASVRGVSPLALATRQGNIELIKALIHAGANVQEPDIIDGALLSHNRTVSIMLLERGAVPKFAAAARFSQQVRSSYPDDLKLIGLIAFIGGADCVQPAVYAALSRFNADAIRLLDFLFYYTPVDFSPSSGGRAPLSADAYTYVLGKGLLQSGPALIPVLRSLAFYMTAASVFRGPHAHLATRPYGQSVFATLYFAANYPRNEEFRKQVQDVPEFKALVSDAEWMQEANLKSLRLLRPERIP